MRADDSSGLIQLLRAAYRCSAVALAIAGCVGETLFRLALGWKWPRERKNQVRQKTLHRWTAWLVLRLNIEVIVE